MKSPHRIRPGSPQRGRGDFEREALTMTLRLLRSKLKLKTGRSDRTSRERTTEDEG